MWAQVMIFKFFLVTVYFLYDLLLHRQHPQYWDGHHSRARLPTKSNYLASNEKKERCSSTLIETLQRLLHELLVAPTNGYQAILQDSIFGIIPRDGTIPWITAILGHNSVQGLRNANVRHIVIIAIVVAIYLNFPVIAIGVAKAAGALGLLSSDPLFSFEM